MTKRGFVEQVKKIGQAWKSGISGTTKKLNNNTRKTNNVIKMNGLSFSIANNMREASTLKTGVAK